MNQCLECPYNTNNKYNFKRHILSNHSKIIKKINNESQNLKVESQNLIVESQNLIVESQNLNDESQNLNDESQNMNNILPNQCLKCNKILSSIKSLKVHIKTCSGINKKECKFCHKVLSSKQSKDNHQLICKDKDKPTTIINNTNNIDNSVTNNNTTNNINNIQNIDNSVTNNTIVFNDKPDGYTLFKTDHITVKEMIQMFKKCETEKDFALRMFEAIWKEPLNRCIMKTNMKTNFSKVLNTAKSWVSMLDETVYGKYLYDMSYTTANLIETNEQPLMQKVKEQKVSSTYLFMNEIAIVGPDDKPKTDDDIKNEIYAMGYEDEEEKQLYEYRAIMDNDRMNLIDTCKKIIRLWAYDNSKQ
jgi:hypothetical protein